MEYKAKVHFNDKLDLAQFDVSNKVGMMVRMMMEGVHQKANPKTPLKDNNLRTAVTKVMDGNKGTITWMVPYAAYQERGMRADGTHVVQHYTTPGTGKEYAKNALEEVMADINNYAMRVGLV